MRIVVSSLLGVDPADRIVKIVKNLRPSFEELKQDEIPRRPRAAQPGALEIA